MSCIKISRERCTPSAAVPLGEFPADKIQDAINAIWSAVAAAETAGDGTVDLKAVLEGVA